MHSNLDQLKILSRKKLLQKYSPALCQYLVDARLADIPAFSLYGQVSITFSPFFPIQTVQGWIVNEQRFSSPVTNCQLVEVWAVTQPFQNINNVVFNHLCFAFGVLPTIQFSSDFRISLYFTGFILAFSSNLLRSIPTA